MKKLLIASLLSVVSFNSFAAEDETKEWFINTLGDSVIVSSTHNAVATLYKSKGEFLNVGFLENSDACSEFKDEHKEAKVHNINGTNVKFSVQCVDEGVKMFYPTTMAGANFVVNQFVKSKQVSIDNKILYSAKGFTKHYKEMLKQLNAL